MTQDLAELKKRVDALKVLLDDPHPWLQGWCDQYHRALARVVDFANPPDDALTGENAAGGQ